MPTFRFHNHTDRTLWLYTCVFLLMLLLDTSRFSTLATRMSEEFPPLVPLSALFTEVAEKTGLKAISHTESTFLQAWTSEKILGTVPASPKTHPPVQPVTPPAKRLTAGQGESSPPPSPSLGMPLPQRDIRFEVRKPKVLIIGDSMIMEGFGPALQRILRKRPDMDVVREGKYSTGLSRQDYFNWPDYLTTLLSKHRPDLIIICMGANDPQDIIDENNKRHHADSASWADIYQHRAEKLLTIATSQGAKVVWAGLPIMSKEPYATRIQKLSKLQQEACAQIPGATFVDCRSVLADEHGAYTSFITNAQGQHIRLRYKDLVHVTEDGGKLLSNHLVPFIEARLDLREGTPNTPVLPLPGYANKLSFFSPSRGIETDYYVFLPENTRQNETFPVLYALHGAAEDGSAWNTHFGVQLQAMATRYRMLIVAPSCGQFSWYLNSTLQPQNSIETFFIRELIPHVRAHFPTQPAQGLMGISMGGHGAVTLGIAHPELFSSISSMSGVLDITRHPEQWQLPLLLGAYPEHMETWKAHSAKEMLAARAAFSVPPMLITTGSQDTMVIKENRSFHALLRQQNRKAFYEENAGRHDWAYWGKELPRHGAFHAGYLTQPLESKKEQVGKTTSLPQSPGH